MSETGSVALLQAVKGMNDILPPESAKWAHVEQAARLTFERYGYREVRTPIVEYTPLFVRSIGEATDVVDKEMYTFVDRDERSVTLRPEGTASVVRAYLEHSVPKKEPVTRWYYSGPMFRHERAQRGRYRQFYQLGVEALGVAEPTVDAEQVAMLHSFLGSLGVTGLDVVVNSVGGPADRPAYRAALAAYLAPLVAELCEDCRRRVDRNPLRVLDCKVESDQRVAAGAPSILDHLGEASRSHFDRFLAALGALDVPHRVDARLVRGLDYYTGVTFEVRATGGDLGAQNTLGGGGRYDRLVEELGGPATCAVGFAVGVERVLLTMPAAPEEFEPRTQVFIASLGESARLAALKLASRLRAAGIAVEVEHRQASLKSQLKRADRLRARVALVLGDDELARGQVVLRDLSAGEQRAVPTSAIEAELARVLVASSRA